MNPKYEQGKDDVKNIRESAEDIGQSREQGQWGQSESQGQEHSQTISHEKGRENIIDKDKNLSLQSQDKGVWGKTKELVQGAKDTIVEGVSSAYDKTKEFIAGDSSPNVKQANRDWDKNKEMKNFGDRK
jgi:hypothetical protein